MRKLEREVKRTVSSLRGTASGVRKGQMRQSVRGTACPVVALLHGAITSILRWWDIGSYECMPSVEKASSTDNVLLLWLGAYTTGVSNRAQDIVISRSSVQGPPVQSVWKWQADTAASNALAVVDGWRGLWVWITQMVLALGLLSVVRPMNVACFPFRAHCGEGRPQHLLPQIASLVKRPVFFVTWLRGDLVRNATVCEYDLVYFSGMWQHSCYAENPVHGSQLRSGIKPRAWVAKEAMCLCAWRHNCAVQPRTGKVRRAITRASTSGRQDVDSMPSSNSGKAKPRLDAKHLAITVNLSSQALYFMSKIRALNGNDSKFSEHTLRSAY